MGQAVLALAHRRILTPHAMTRNDTLYNPPNQPRNHHNHSTHHIEPPWDRNEVVVLTTSSPRSPRKWEDLPIRRRLDQARGDNLFKSPITDGGECEPRAGPPASPQ